MAKLTYRAAAGLPPGCFALVMAAGIISSDAKRLRLPALSWALFAVGAAAYLVLVGLSCVRLTRFRARVRRDLSDPGAAFAFFTFVAGTDVLAARLPPGAWLIAVLAVGAGTYVLLTRPVARTVLWLPRSTRWRVAGGDWLLAVVALQSVVIVATALPGRLRPHGVMVGALAAWIIGLALYVLLIAFVARRLADDPGAFRPDSWITMGALAISTLAGARLLGLSRSPHMLANLHGTIEAIVWVAWAAGTCWIPVVLALEWSVPGALRSWRDRWSTVFPLGMYAAASLAMSARLGAPALGSLGRVFFWIALGAWVLTAGGLVRSLRTGWLGTRSSDGGPIR